MTIEDLITTNHIGFEARLTGPNLYSCRITHEDRGMTVHHLPKTAGQPTAIEVLTRLMAVARLIDKTRVPRPEGHNGGVDTPSFRIWCRELNLDQGSATTWKTYVLSRRGASQLRYVLGDELYLALKGRRPTVAAPGNDTDGERGQDKKDDHRNLPPL